MGSFEAITGKPQQTERTYIIHNPLNPFRPVVATGRMSYVRYVRDAQRRSFLAEIHKTIGKCIADSTSVVTNYLQLVLLHFFSWFNE